MPLLPETAHVATESEHAMLPNKEAVPAANKSPLADLRLWLDFAIIFVLGLAVLHLIA